MRDLGWEPIIGKISMWGVGVEVVEVDQVLWHDGSQLKGNGNRRSGMQRVILLLQYDAATSIRMSAMRRQQRCSAAKIRQRCQYEGQK